MIDRHPKPGFVLPGDDWLSRPARAGNELETLIVGIFIGFVLTAGSIALGAWVFT
ncbi:hypothetical protein J2Y48_003109 [Mycoplana sp. BE70]|uniref:hypothetical protein n=1 Tax=Mycoplana sp. BE70 TaxID=2817775 RepID=UPI002866E9BE|nr:hypothetical protein [Mycoplana sp. BE70]MDR6757812.1 hypothetical protein [Mycoplana sp. BE70]